MTNLEALILQVVSERGRSHGFAVGQAIEAATGREPSVGSLYKALHRLERAGYLVASDQDDERHQGPPRRYYRVNAVGERVLEGHREQHARIGRALGLNPRGSVT